MRMNLSELIRMMPDLVMRKIRSVILDRKIRREYMHLNYFKAKRDNAQKGLSDTQKYIVNLESQRRKI